MKHKDEYGNKLKLYMEEVENQFNIKSRLLGLIEVDNMLISIIL